MKAEADATFAYAHLFQALAEPQRLAIVQHLASGPHRVRDLVEHMGLAQSTVSKHVAFLMDVGLLHARPEGRATWYSLAEPTQLNELLVAAQRILQATDRHQGICDYLHVLPGDA